MLFRAIVFSLVIFSPSLCAGSDKAAAAGFKKEYSQYKVFSENKDWRTALPHAEKAYEIGLSLLGEEHKTTAALQYNWGFTLAELGRDEEAEQVLEAALLKYEALYGRSGEELIPVLMDLARSRAAMFEGTYDEKSTYLRALNIAEKIYGKDSVYYGRLAGEAGSILVSKSRSRVGKRFLLASYESFSAALGEQHPQTGLAAFHLGKYEMAVHDNKDAVEYFNVTLASFTQPDQPSNEVEMLTHAFMVQAYERMGESENATRHCIAIGSMTPAMPSQKYKPLYKVAPMYPRSAQEQKQEGYVIVEYTVDEQGFVVKPRVVNSEGPSSFSSVALEAARKFRYAPQFKDGKTVSVEGVQNKFTFTLM